MGITITRNGYAPEAPSVIAQWRTYTWCVDPFTQRRNAPPCDTMIGNMIEDGGIASIALFHLQGQDDQHLTGVVVATSDPNGLGPWGTSLPFTMLPGNLLQVGTGDQATLFCDADTDYSQYSEFPCGA